MFFRVTTPLEVQKNALVPILNQQEMDDRTLFSEWPWTQYMSNRLKLLKSDIFLFFHSSIKLYH